MLGLFADSRCLINFFGKRPNVVPIYVPSGRFSNNLDEMRGTLKINIVNL